MEKYDRHDTYKPDKPYDPLEPGKLKHCELFDRCLDNCSDCIFKNLYNLESESGVKNEGNDRYDMNEEGNKTRGIHRVE